MTLRQEVEKLKWKKFPVLNDGFVTLVDVMGNDYSIVQAARVSHGDDVRENPDHEMTKEDIGLLRYLMSHRHTTPFEMVEFKFLVRVPMDCWRQWIRHRTANVNEYSTRYSPAINSQQTTPTDEWREQTTKNKQGSAGHLSSSDGVHLSAVEKEFHAKVKEVYEERISYGVAREQARKDLPLSTYTEAYWKIDLHNLFHFLGLRLDSHAQKEIRAYANAMADIICKCVPAAWDAFCVYRLNAMQLSEIEVEVVQLLLREVVPTRQVPITTDGGFESTFETVAGIPRDRKSRERDECFQKLQCLGLFKFK